MEFLICPTKFHKHSILQRHTLALYYSILKQQQELKAKTYNQDIITSLSYILTNWNNKMKFINQVQEQDTEKIS